MKERIHHLSKISNYVLMEQGCPTAKENIFIMTHLIKKIKTGEFFRKKIVQYFIVFQTFAIRIPHNCEL